MEKKCKICDKPTGFKDGRRKFCQQCIDEAEQKSKETGTPVNMCLRIAYDSNFRQAAKDRAALEEDLAITREDLKLTREINDRLIKIEQILQEK